MTGVDLITTAIVAAAVQGIGRVASAPIDALGEHLKERIKARLDRTREAAEAKTGGRPLDVADRIAFKALGEAAISDDPLMADYLGGVLAASGPNNDEGAAVIAMIGRLSSLQLRVHYIIYREIRRLWPDPSLNLYETPRANQAGVRIPTTEMMRAVGRASGDRTSGDAIGSAIAVLQNEGLIADEWYFAVEEPGGPETHSTRVRPTGLGAELFLWGHGAQPIRANRLLDRRTQLVFLTDVPGTPSSSLLTPPARS
jgi:hypothetical protein